MAEKQKQKAAEFAGFDDVQFDSPHVNDLERASNALTGMSQVRPIRGASAGCKPGFSRKTYVLPEEMIGKLKAIAGHLGKSEVTIVLDMLTKGIDSYEKEYGEGVTHTWNATS